jgi:peptidoglycan hydrolase CwlO-like protein
MATNFPTSASLTGAQELNRMHLKAAQEDLGSKIEKMISNINEMQTTVSTLNLAVSYLNVGVAQMIACAASFASALSTANLTSAAGSNTATVVLSLSAVSNFRASHPA